METKLASQACVDVVVVVVVRRVRCTTTSRAKDGGQIGRQIRLYGSQSYSFLNGVRAVSDLMSERGARPGSRRWRERGPAAWWIVLRIMRGPPGGNADEARVIDRWRNRVDKKGHGVVGRVGRVGRCPLWFWRRLLRKGGVVPVCPRLKKRVRSLQIQGKRQMSIWRCASPTALKFIKPRKSTARRKQKGTGCLSCCDPGLRFSSQSCQGAKLQVPAVKKGCPLSA